jgi:hypothetical protein
MIRKTLSIATCLFLFLQLSAQDVKPVDVVKASLVAYNKSDIEEFMQYFSEDVVMKDFDKTEVNAKGKAEVRAIFEPYFEASPNLHSKIIDRITFDNKVMDHEYITGARGSSEAFEIVVIYEVMDGKIKSMLAVRKSK